MHVVRKYLLLNVAVLGTLQATEYETRLADLKRQERFADAISYVNTYIEQSKQPDIKLYVELGYLNALLGRGTQALAAYQKVLDRMPNQPQVLYNMGYVHKMCGNNDAAIACYQDVLSIYPDYENAHFGLSRAYLQKGEFKKGWQAAEPYFKKSGKYAEQLRRLVTDNKLAGSTILLRPEGGLGDTLQFVRYAQTLHEAGAHVIVAAQNSLMPLLSRCPYIDQLLPLGAKLPAYDADATLMSMPAVMNSDETTIPKTFPYLYADATLSAQWAQRLPHDGTLKIGLCWQASVSNDASRAPVARRGIALSHFYPLGNLKGISFYNLQQHDGLEQLNDVPTSFPLITFQNLDSNEAFMDTAAIIQNLDLVITVDTAIAHLAGGLGVPVWLLLPFETDWRWIAGRTDTPWYPNMVIFQQPNPFDWDSVVEDLAWVLTRVVVTNDKSWLSQRSKLI